LTTANVAADPADNKALITPGVTPPPREGGTKVGRDAKVLTFPPRTQQEDRNNLPRIARPWAHPDDDYKWRSDDGTTVVWTVGGGDWRICTRDPARARRLRRLTRVKLVAECVFGGFEEYFQLDTRKLDTLTVRRILVGNS